MCFMFIVCWAGDASWFTDKTQDWESEPRYTKEARKELVNAHLGRDRYINSDIARHGKGQTW